MIKIDATAWIEFLRSTCLDVNIPQLRLDNWFADICFIYQCDNAHSDDHDN